MPLIDGKEWKLVPVEPTEEMLDAICNAPLLFSSPDDSVLREHWALLLAAAPTPPEATEAAQTLEIENLKKTFTHMSQIIHDMVVAQQAAWIEWQHGRGAEAAMAWIQNGLVGPGHIPDEDESWGKEAQAWYDANCSNALPACFCGRPSNIGWMGKGFCSNTHYREAQQAATGSPLQEPQNEG